jgi:hypothetical protein
MSSDRLSESTFLTEAFKLFQQANMAENHHTDTPDCTPFKNKMGRHEIS